MCWKNRCRIEPQDARPLPHLTVPDIDDVLKWQELFGASRALFTIREEEEEREGLESENIEATTKRVCQLEELYEGSDSVAQVEVTVKVEDDATTPFSTPCGSPPYYTPLPSPARDELKEYSEEEDADVSAGEKVPMSVSLQIHDA